MEKILRTDKEFPFFLKDLRGGPKELYCDGKIELLQSRMIAVVGSRKCTQYGKTVAKAVGKRLGESGATVVSGLARGIDTYSHQGALEVKGNTIAVLGSGCDRYYPPENKNLQEQIRREGLLVSEYPPGTEARSYNFPSRNRIISGLSESIIVVEAGNRSGALITAESGVEQGKEVYAIPGNITSLYSFGPNKLIREGAKPLVLIDDVLIDLDIKPYIKETISDTLGRDERIIYNVISGCGEMTIDEIYHKTNIKPSVISGIITILEMKGLIFSSLGKVFVAKF